MMGFWDSRGISWKLVIITNRPDSCFPEISLPGTAFQFVIRIDSIRYANRFELVRFVKKSAFRFTSYHAVFLAYL